jgi:hypothetical protein
MSAVVLAAALLAAPVTDPAASAAVIPASQQAFAECVSQRESRGNYKARGSDSSSAGRWQFLDRPWRVNGGLAWMVAARLREFGMTGPASKSVRIHLQATPIAAWEPAYQDAAFVAVLNARGPWSGWRHWYLAGSRCNALVGGSR